MDYTQFFIALLKKANFHCAIISIAITSYIFYRYGYLLPLSSKRYYALMFFSFSATYILQILLIAAYKLFLRNLIDLEDKKYEKEKARAIDQEALLKIEALWNNSLKRNEIQLLLQEPYPQYNNAFYCPPNLIWSSELWGIQLSDGTDLFSRVDVTNNISYVIVHPKVIEFINSHSETQQL